MLGVSKRGMWGETSDRVLGAKKNETAITVRVIIIEPTRKLHFSLDKNEWTIQPLNPQRIVI